MRSIIIAEETDMKTILIILLVILAIGFVGFLLPSIIGIMIGVSMIKEGSVI